MTDPIDQIFNGEPGSVDEDDLLKMQAAEEAAELKVAAPQEESEASPTPQAQPSEEPAKAEKPKEESGKLEFKGMSKEDILGGKEVRPGEELFAGVSDWVVDAVNVTGLKAPKLPKYENEVAQAVREITSVVAPTVALSMTGIGALDAAAKGSKVKLLSDPFVKWLGKTAFSAGAGASVDLISETSEGDNLSGSLKKSFPRTYAWIPDDIATLDTDSPDVKRIKNATEGTGLGIFADVLGGFATILRNAQSVRNATKWIPESEKAKKWLASNLDEASDDVEEVIAKSAAKRSDDLDSIGSYNFSKSQNLDEPIFGLHDMYGYEEMGIRSADDLGVVGASVDLVRIQNNLDSSYGRLGSVMTEPALKFALEGVDEYDAVMRGLRDSLSDAGEYGYRLNDGRLINSKTIGDAAEQLAEDMGYMTNKQLDEFLERNKTLIDKELGTKTLGTTPMVAVKKQLKSLMKEFGDVSDALVRTSVAGQVSDMSFAARLADGRAATPRLQEQILDRIELLMIANGEAGKQRGFLLKMMDTAKRGFKPLSPDELRKKGADITAQLKAESKQTIDTLREISQKRPDMLGPLLLAYEATDGNVKTMDALNNYMRQSTGVLRKAFIDRQPEIPSVVMQGFWANVYNSTLSAFATPIKAGAANAALLVERPITTMIGSLSDKYMRRRAWYQYSAMGDSLRKGLKYMGETMRRSALDPNYSGVAGRESMVQQNTKQLEVMNAFADAKAAEGDFGPQAMMAQIEAINDLAQHPWLRFGTRAMQAADGFTQAVIGNVEARGRAFDQVARNANIDADAMDQVAEAAYKEIWKLDEKGRAIISDDAVRRASGEIAMNLDNSLNSGLSEIIRHVPAAKPFLLFTKTPINMMGFAASHSPMGLFIDEVNQFGRSFDQIPADQAKKLLKTRGIPFDENAEIAYNAIRAEMKGRKAIGTLAVMSAIGLMMNDSLTGNGFFDRQKQQLRRSVDWKPRSIKVNGKWVSYDNLGAVTDLLALTADIMDNYDVLGEGDLAQLLNGLGFVLSASITDKSMLAGIEPIYDIFSGNGGAINRWAASFMPAATMPGSSQMAELTRLMSPNLRVVEENLAAMLANRTPAKLALPKEYDFVDGGEVNGLENFFARLYNTYSPWKVNGEISSEKQFLIDIEYDKRPSMDTDGRGVKLTPQEQSDIARLMGKNKTFKKAIQRVMRSTEGKAFREAFKKAQADGMEPQLKNFANIHSELDRYLNLAKEEAIRELDAQQGGSILERRADNVRSNNTSLTANIDEILDKTKVR